MLPEAGLAVARAAASAAAAADVEVRLPFFSSCLAHGLYFAAFWVFPPLFSLFFFLFSFFLSWF